MTRPRNAILWLLGLGLVGNGLFMLLVPGIWYHTLPTVSATGAFNPHFVRDIGAAYAVAGGTLLWLALDLAGGRAAAVTGGMFLTLHALVHLWDAAAGRASPAHLSQDFVPVIAVPLLICWLVWPQAGGRQGKQPC